MTKSARKNPIRGTWCARSAGWAAAVFCGLLLATAACDTYDPPPEAEMKHPPQGQWLPDSPLEILFSEPIDGSTLELSIWPAEFGPEGNLLPQVEPVVAPCAPASESCEPVEVELGEDGMTAVIRQNGAFSGREGKPHFVRVGAGLRDLAGRTRKVPTRLSFRVTPLLEKGPVDIALNTGVITLTSDLSGILPGTYLRMVIDVGICPETGDTVLMATVAGKAPDAAQNTNDPNEIHAKLNAEGWTVQLEGDILTRNSPDGSADEYFLRTDPQDLDVMVLGLIRVRLQELQLSGKVVPADPEFGGRDHFQGQLTSEKVLMGDDGDVTDLGAAVADYRGFGLFDGEIEEGLPRLVDPEPCATLLEGGGDCQLELPWTAPACGGE